MTFLLSAQPKIPADLLLINGRVYTAGSRSESASSFAVADGRFIAVGSSEEILAGYESKTVIDLRNRFVYPGFIDAHCHFYGYAVELERLDLTGKKSWEELLQFLQERQHTLKGEWVVGRGWDQNIWPVKVFPDRRELDRLFPDRPVVLVRIDGHSLIANGEALKRAGIGLNHRFSLQEVEVKEGRLTGILSETAADYMRGVIPVPRGQAMAGLLEKAERNCFAAGLTTVADAGLEHDTVDYIDSLQRAGVLRMRIYAMLSPTKENFESYVMKGVYRTDRLDVRSVKIYADGSLGSRTALLKRPYSDDPSASGILVTPISRMQEIAAIAYRYGYQVNTHAIGDSAVNLVLLEYGTLLGKENDLRWRIEHAQVVDPADLEMFRRWSVIPSVQATHATSDMRWAGDRLGSERIKSAYAYRDLMLQNGWIANGTDFPIENIRPLGTFYAAVTRMDATGYPAGGFQPENALSRDDALRSITTWAAKACFEEGEKGSIEAGKFADFVILDTDLLKCSNEELLKAKVVETWLGGERVYPE